MQKSIFFALLLLVSFSACKEETDDITTTVQTQTVSNLAADAVQPYTGQFTLFSLADNAIIPNSDSASTRWDIGFKGTTIIVNGGAVRTGQGGAYVHTGIFSELTEIPESQVFAQDASDTDLAIPTGSGNGWYSYDHATYIVSPLAGRVLVVRTATGKYAKIEILSYYQNAPATPSASDASRYYTFRYAYQADGSKKF